MGREYFSEAEARSLCARCRFAVAQPYSFRQNRGDEACWLIQCIAPVVPAISPGREFFGEDGRRNLVLHLSYQGRNEACTSLDNPGEGCRVAQAAAVASSQIGSHVIPADWSGVQLDPLQGEITFG